MDISEPSRLDFTAVLQVWLAYATQQQQKARNAQNTPGGEGIVQISWTLEITKNTYIKHQTQNKQKNKTKQNKLLKYYFYFFCMYVSPSDGQYHSKSKIIAKHNYY